MHRNPPEYHHILLALGIVLALVVQCLVVMHPPYKPRERPSTTFGTNVARNRNCDPGNSRSYSRPALSRTASIGGVGSQSPSGPQPSYGFHSATHDPPQTRSSGSQGNNFNQSQNNSGYQYQQQQNRVRSAGSSRGQGHRQMPTIPIPPTGYEAERYHAQPQQSQWQVLSYGSGYTAHQGQPVPGYQDGYISNPGYSVPQQNYNQAAVFYSQPPQQQPNQYFHAAVPIPSQLGYPMQANPRFSPQRQQTVIQNGPMPGAVVTSVGPPPAVPLFVNPDLIAQGAAVHVWQNTDGYSEFYAQSASDGRLNRIGHHAENLAGDIQTPAGDSPVAGQNPSLEEKKSEHRQSNASDTVSSFSSAHVTRRSSSPNNSMLTSGVEQPSLSTAESQMGEICPSLRREIEDWFFNGLNFPMITQENTNSEQRTAYDNLLNSVSTQIKTFFLENPQMWDACDSTSRMVRLDDHYQWVNEDPKPIENGTDETKTNKNPLKIECFLPVKAIEVPDDYISSRNGRKNRLASRKNPRSMKFGKHKAKVFTKLVKAKDMMKSLYNNHCHLPVKFEKQELADIHTLLQEGQRPVIVMLADFSRDHRIIGDEVGEPDRPEVPDDSDNDDDNYEDAVEVADDVPGEEEEQNVIDMADDVANSEGLPVDISTNATPSEEEYPIFNTTGSNRNSPVELPTSSGSLNHPFTSSQARPLTTTRSSRLQEFTNGSASSSNHERANSTMGNTYMPPAYHRPRRQRTEECTRTTGRRRQLPQIPTEHREAAEEEARRMFGHGITPEQREADRRRLTAPIRPLRQPHHRPASQDTTQRQRTANPADWMNRHPHLTFLMPSNDEFLARIPFPPYYVPLIGFAHREQGDTTPLQRTLPAHESFSHFRARMQDFLDDDETGRGSGALLLSPVPSFWMPTDAEYQALCREFDEQERRRRNGEGSSGSGSSSSNGSSSSQGN